MRGIAEFIAAFCLLGTVAVAHLFLFGLPWRLGKGVVFLGLSALVIGLARRYSLGPKGKRGFFAGSIGAALVLPVIAASIEDAYANIGNFRWGEFAKTFIRVLGDGAVVISTSSLLGGVLLGWVIATALRRQRIEESAARS